MEKSETLDPAQHPWTVLAAFIESLADSDWRQLLDRRIAWERQAVEVRSRSPVAAKTLLPGSPAIQMTLQFRDPLRLVKSSTSCRRSMLLWRLEHSREASHRRC